MSTRVNDFMKTLRKVLPKLPDRARKAIQDRAMSLHRLYEKVWVALPYDEWLVDLLVDGDSFSAITGREANLYLRTVSFNADDIELGDPLRIVESYEVLPENRSLDTIKRFRGTIQIIRGDNDEYRWLMRACTSVLNRVAEIDSEELFDCFTERFFDDAFDDAFLTVRHMGMDCYLGDADWVARDGHIFCASGTFDDNEENILAQAAIISLERDADYWGVSIGYKLEEEDPAPDIITHNMRVGDNDIVLPIPVFRKGTLVECSILDETECAAFFTDIVRMEVLEEMPTKRKTRNFDRDLLTLLGSQEAVDAYKAGNESTNRSIDDEGLITRASVDVDDEVDVDDDDEVDVDELWEQLAANPDFIALVAQGIADVETTDEEPLREMLARALTVIGEMDEELIQLREDHAKLLSLDGDKQRRAKGNRKTNKRPRDQKRQSQQKGDSDDGYEDHNELLTDVLETIPEGQ